MLIRSRTAFCCRRRIVAIMAMLLGLMIVACVPSSPNGTPPQITSSLAPSVTLPPVATLQPTATPKARSTVTPTPTSVNVTTVYITHTVTATSVLTTPLPLSTLPFGVLLVAMGETPYPTTPSTWAVDIYALSPQDQGLWIADGMAKLRPSLSPDGEKVAYAVDEPGGESIWIARPDGTAARRLTPLYPRGGDTVQYLSPYGWSADSKEFAYMRQSEYEPFNSQLYLANVTTGLIRPVGEKGLRDANWNPKRLDELLVLQFQISTGFCLLDVRTGDCVAVGGEIPRLRREGFGVWGFTPDGEGFYLVHEGLLIITGREGHIQKQIHVNVPIGDVRWSPDGQRLLFAIFDGQGAADVYVMDSQGTDWHRVIPRQVFPRTAGSAKMTVHLGSWTADSQWFTIFNRSTAGPGSEIYVCHATTGELHKVLISEQGIRGYVWVP